MHIKDALTLADALPRKTLPEYTLAEQAILALAGAYRRQTTIIRNLKVNVALLSKEN